MVRGAKTAVAIIGLMLLAGFSPLLSVPLGDNHEVQNTGGRATITWSGTQVLTSDYTVPVGDTLLITAGTTVTLDDYVRIYVEGELDITGTASSPVTITRSGDSISHEGIQFNATSRNRGSVIQHLVIEHSEWGITIYDSNPWLADVYIDNPDYVGIDLFDHANPFIQRLTVQNGGQDVASLNVNSRYGIGLSAGVSSYPTVIGATFDGLTTRGLNIWGDSHGYFADISIHNISSVGAGGWISAGIWVEDSLGLYNNVSVNKTDNGIWVKHISENSTTRPTFQHATVSNSMYRGVFVEQGDHSDYNNIQLNAIFDNLTVRGSGGPLAKTPGLCYYAIGLNTTGVDMTNVVSEDNVCNGFKAYMIDSATLIENLTIRNSGNPSAVPVNDRAGFFCSWCTRAANIDNLTVSGSDSHGIMLSVATITGSNWVSHNNSATGLFVRQSFPEVYNLELSDNGHNGLRVYDSANVKLFDLNSQRNGLSATIPESGVGMFFEKSNDVMSATKNVSCTRCSSTEDAWGGVRVEDSIDLQLTDLSVTNPGNNGIAVDVDNTGMVFNGWVDLHGLTIQANRSGPIVQFVNTEARVSDVSLSGTHGGFAWDGGGESITSELSNSSFAGLNCIEFTDLHLVVADHIDLSGCTGQINLRDSTVNLSRSTLGSTVSFDMTGQPSTLRWIDSGYMDASLQNIGVGSIIDEMWTMHIWATNQANHGLPHAVVNISFSGLNGNEVHTMPYEGNAVLGPFVAQRTDWTQSSAWTDYSMGCEYDEQRGDFNMTPIPHNRVIPYTSPLVICSIMLSNQAPLIIWSTPLHEDLYSSGGEVTFNASDTWDLDDDAMTFTWSSSLDGVINTAGSTSLFTVNDGSGNVLSDGVHDITLDVCDNQGNCANETRQIELRNLPPVITIETDPAVDLDGTLRLFRTVPLHVNMSQTYDPEGDTILCIIDVSYREGDTGAPYPCPDEWNESFTDASDGVTQFDYTITITDDVNPSVSIIYAIELVNELPRPDFVMTTSGNTSGDTVYLDGTASFDPEGDPIIVKWESDVIGELPDDDDGNDLLWNGRLPAGTHQITLSLSDTQANHIGSWSTQTQELIVENSEPVAIISSHVDFSTDSSVLHTFEAHGSGDWDLSCDLFDEAWVLNHLCEDGVVANADNVAVRWDSSSSETALGTDWSLTTRLPAGLQTLTFTIDDSVHPPVNASIEIDVSPSAPVLIVSSPVPGITVDSDAPVLFDFRSSFDADGDDFIVNISSNLMEGLIVENGSTNWWYNDFLPAGEHTITFTLTDSTDMVRIVNQTLIVNPTGPIAVIEGLAEGQYINPGELLHFDGSLSYDADDDIIQWLWHQIIDGQSVEIANDANFSMWIPPGQATFTLTVRDSEGASDTAQISIIVGSSNPILSGLEIDQSKLEIDVMNTVIVSVVLSDADGTTQMDGSVNGHLMAGGNEYSFILLDDGSGEDLLANDGIYTGVLSTEITSDASFGLIEVWASDGDLMSNTVKKQLPINKPKGMSGIAELLSSTGIIALAGAMLVLAILGGLNVLRNKRRLAADLEMIESWGAGLGGGTVGFDDIVDETGPKEPDMDAEAPPGMSDFGELD